MEGLAATEYQGFTETSIVVPSISKEINETVLDTTRIKEKKLVEGISEVMDQKKNVRGYIQLCIYSKPFPFIYFYFQLNYSNGQTKELDGKDTIKKDEVTLAAKQGEKCMVEHVRNPDASSTEKLPPREYCEELAEHSSV